jgi:hypothetical protein
MVHWRGLCLLKSGVCIPWRAGSTAVSLVLLGRGDRGAPSDASKGIGEGRIFPHEPIQRCLKRHYVALTLRRGQRCHEPLHQRAPPSRTGTAALTLLQRLSHQVVDSDRCHSFRGVDSGWHNPTPSRMYCLRVWGLPLAEHVGTQAQRAASREGQSSTVISYV